MNFKIFSANKPNYLINRINNFYTTSKQLFETHYEVLNLKRDCSAREIKDAFIQLSKQYHPDVTNDVKTQKKFVRILEAYNTLSKPHLRRNYDLGLIKPINSVRTTSPNFHQYDPQYERATRDPSFWEYRDKSKDKYYEARDYYGIKGVNKVSNKIIVVVCLLFAAFGVTLQVILIRKSVTFKRGEIMRKSMEAEEALRSVRNDAMKYGNKIQLERMKERFEKQELAQKLSTAAKD